MPAYFDNGTQSGECRRDCLDIILHLLVRVEIERHHPPGFSFVCICL
jgi:hypothetical protein